MNYWKQGCVWGGGNPSFYPLVKRRGIVISPNRNFDIGDLVAISADGGKQINAVAKIEAKAVSITESEVLESECSEYKIDYNRDVFAYNVYLYELGASFDSRIRQANGCGINQADIREKMNKSVNGSDNKYEYVERNMSKLNVNVILYGSPGTGKTYRTINKALEIIDPSFSSKNNAERLKLKKRFDQLLEEGKIAFTTFHQSFSYEDFVEGIRADTVDDKLKYYIEDGVFKKIARAASLQANSSIDAEKSNYVLIIDEINRGNTANIFGELITLIEPSKRAGAPEALSVTLPYSKKTFSVPDNLYIIGTMNTADRSLAVMDAALRRRFHFIEMMPDYGVLKELNINGVEVDKLLRCINDRIEILYDREHTLGHAFFTSLLDSKNPGINELAGIFKQKVFPLLQEYFFEDWGKIELILGSNIVTKELIKHNLSNSDFPEKYRYEINEKALNVAQTYIDIYAGY